ncbi:MAG: hypothetical protein IEMM0008_1049 [bacterium]|nr:MAG: hypothetical protein IEMM0008_1049 [bacterium]
MSRKKKTSYILFIAISLGILMGSVFQSAYSTHIIDSDEKSSYCCQIQYRTSDNIDRQWKNDVVKEEVCLQIRDALVNKGNSISSYSFVPGACSK